MELNSNILKLTGTAEILEPLELGKRYAIGMEVGITDKKDVDNENGTYNTEFKARLIRAEIQKDLGVIKTKDKTKQSTQTRFSIIAAKNNYQSELDDEDWYILIQKGIRSHLPEIINLILKK